jgi:hemolysin activation/secretion protein
MERFALFVAVAVCMFAATARAQVGGLHILGTGELQPSRPPQVSATQPAAPHGAVAAPVAGAFVLRGVVIEGASSVPTDELLMAWAPALGKVVNQADLSRIAARIGEMEGAAGLALYAVSFPSQNFAHGIVRIRVTEVSVAHVVITGEVKGRKLGLLEAYAENIEASRPLMRSVLERNILLMGDLAGTKIGSRFVPVVGEPDLVQLVLDVRSQKIFGGIGLNNEGTPQLDESEAVLNAGVNNLLREGERTQILLGLPLDFSTYQYYGLDDTEPLGTNGWTLTLSAGELVSHPVNHDGISGNATLLGFRLNDPVLRSVHRNVFFSVGMDAINSANAFLGFTDSDERTRTLRVSLSYNDDLYLNGINQAGATVSEGLYVLGARPAGPAYGPPDFSKGNFDLERIQALPYEFALRVAAQGQFTNDRLPPSEEFEYGGPEFGQAFTAAALTGDEGIEAVAQLGHPIPLRYLPAPLAGSGLYVLTDYGEIWNRDTVYAPPTDKGASFGFGVKFLVVGKLSVEVGAATPIMKPEYAGTNERWRFVVATSGRF